METKKSKVIGVQANGSWESKYGTFYKFEVDFENGDGGEYSSKSQTQSKFVSGQEAWYTIEGSGKFAKVKPAQAPEQQQSNGGGYSAGSFKGENPETAKRIARMNALTNATNYIMAKGATELGELEILNLANAFEDFIMNGLKAKQSPPDLHF